MNIIPTNNNNNKYINITDSIDIDTDTTIVKDMSETKEINDCPICLYPLDNNDNTIIIVTCCNNKFHTICYLSYYLT